MSYHETGGLEIPILGRSFEKEDWDLYHVFRAAWGSAMDRVWSVDHTPEYHFDGPGGEIRPVFEAFCNWLVKQ